MSFVRPSFKRCDLVAGNLDAINARCYRCPRDAPAQISRGPTTRPSLPLSGRHRFLSVRLRPKRDERFATVTTINPKRHQFYLNNKSYNKLSKLSLAITFLLFFSVLDLLMLFELFVYLRLTKIEILFFLHTCSSDCFATLKSRPKHHLFVSAYNV